ncbi:hypothetical protein JCM3774_006702 [Rhodotorula dairenensis]
MVGDEPRTHFSFWTPAIPPLEHRLPRNGFFVSGYRLLRTAWLLLTLPAHLALLFASLVAPSPLHRHWICTVADFHPLWNSRQRLVYPLLRRTIWAIADVGSADALTPNARFKFPWWAWALEEFTVRIGRGARVQLQATEVELPRLARTLGWVQNDGMLDPSGQVGFGPVPCFWFERADLGGPSSTKDSIDRRASKGERIVLYFVGGGYVTGSPTEGSRCFKLAREAGLRVVGANFRKATSPDQAFPAQLQDALAVYAHLVLELGFHDIVLAGDSAGSNLALMLVQYLARLEVPRSGRFGSNAGFSERGLLLMPTGLLLFSPWCDLTAATYGEAILKRKGMRDDPKHDIICASMATNSIRLFLARLLGEGCAGSQGAKSPQHSEADGVATLRSAHPWFSPCLATAESSWNRVSEVYARRSGNRSAGERSASVRWRRQQQPLRVLVTTGTTELFNLEIVRLCEILNRAGSRAQGGGIAVQVVSAEGEVHAFPLVPEWVSPEASEAWRKIQRWLRE